MRTCLLLIAVVALQGSEAVANKSLRDAKRVAKGLPSKMGATVENLRTGDQIGDYERGSNPRIVSTRNKNGTTTLRTFVRGRHLGTRVSATGDKDPVRALRYSEAVTHGERRISTKKRGESILGSKERWAPLGKGR